MRQNIVISSLVRKHSEIFCSTLIIRRSRSSRLLSNGTAKSSKNRNMAHLLSEKRFSRLWAGLCLSRPEVRFDCSDFFGTEGGELARYPSVRRSLLDITMDFQRRKFHVLLPTARTSYPKGLKSREFTSTCPRCSASCCTSFSSFSRRRSTLCKFSRVSRVLGWCRSYACSWIVSAR